MLFPIKSYAEDNNIYKLEQKVKQLEKEVEQLEEDNKLIKSNLDLLLQEYNSNIHWKEIKSELKDDLNFYTTTYLGILGLALTIAIALGVSVPMLINKHNDSEITKIHNKISTLNQSLEKQQKIMYLHDLLNLLLNNSQEKPMLLKKQEAIQKIIPLLLEEISCCDIYQLVHILGKITDSLFIINNNLKSSSSTIDMIKLINLIECNLPNEDKNLQKDFYSATIRYFSEVNNDIVNTCKYYIKLTKLYDFVSYESLDNYVLNLLDEDSCKQIQEDFLKEIIIKFQEHENVEALKEKKITKLDEIINELKNN